MNIPTQVTLSASESEAVLNELDNLPLRSLRINDVLFTAISKLSGNYHYSATAGVNDCGPGEDAYIWVLKFQNNKVALIKAVRALMGLDLATAKNYVEGTTGMQRLNGDVIVKPKDVKAGIYFTNVYATIDRNVMLVRELA